jgi:hypothetical protein
MVVYFRAQDRMVREECPTLFGATVVLTAAKRPRFGNRIKDHCTRGVYVSQKNFPIRQHAGRSIADVVPSRWWRDRGPRICHGIVDFGCEEVHLDPRVIFAAGYENPAIFEDGGGIVKWRI